VGWVTGCLRPAELPGRYVERWLDYKQHTNKCLNLRSHHLHCTSAAGGEALADGEVKLGAGAVSVCLHIGGTTEKFYFSSRGFGYCFCATWTT